MGEYVEQVISRRQRRSRRPLRQSTADLYRKDWTNRGVGPLGAVLLTELSRERVSEWWDSLGSTPTQDGRCYDLLKSVLAEAVEDGVISENPCRVRGAGKPAPTKRREALTVPEVLEYLEAVPERYRLPLMTAAWCGLRSGEVRGLRRCDVDLDGGLLRVEQAVSRVRDGEHSYRWEIGAPKTAAAVRTVAMPDVMIPAMREHLEAAPLKTRDALVFPSVRDPRRPLSESQLRGPHEKGRAAISRPSLTVHDLRSTAATLAAQGGATTSELMRLLGHTTVHQAMGYQVAADARDRDRASRLDALIRGSFGA